MNNITVYSDFIEDAKNPKWIVINNIDWYHEVIYISSELEYKDENIINFHFEDYAVSVLLSDLLINKYMPNHVGISLKKIKERVIETGININYIENINVRVVDFKEVINMNLINRRNL
ncbi:hypothetical protein [Paraliobacillus ryukyuensis]|uniref:hypothetical protein n=1 Tax=Paraliobacillus ryukyuensis TaxID=200904 RepID=UPI0009A9012B|nr:hypothetical protein [Paraliobacillus ryukyuensis]